MKRPYNTPYVDNRPAAITTWRYPNKEPLTSELELADATLPHPMTRIPAAQKTTATILIKVTDSVAIMTVRRNVKMRMRPLFSGEFTATGRFDSEENQNTDELAERNPSSHAMRK